MKQRLVNILFSFLLLITVIVIPDYDIQNLEAAADHFTIAVLPDTQMYSQNAPAIFDQQAQWIVDNAQSENIVFVAHLGDLVNVYGSSTQWQNAKNSMAIIRDAGIPYSVVPGNHDMVFWTTDMTNTNYDIYFPFTDFIGYSWYGGHFPSNNANNYELFSAMGQNFVILNLVCAPSLLNNETITWANDILTQYSNRKAIIITHGYINAAGVYIDSDSVAGTDIWDNIVKLHGNVIAVLCGHYSGEYCNTAIGDNGNTIYNLLTDYQDYSNGGNGWLRLYEFYPDLNLVKAITYSPYLDEYDTSTYGQFDLYLDMSITNYNISASVTGGNGTIATNPDIVTSGGYSTVTFTPDRYYKVSTVLDNGVDVTVQVFDNTYTIDNIGTNHVIVVTFIRIPVWDLNEDKTCDVSDLVAVGLHWGQTGTSGWIAEDINKDGMIDVADLVAIGLHWGESW
jgi:3',5'-cyclic AMP phosphodiesterase CpdA